MQPASRVCTRGVPLHSSVVEDEPAEQCLCFSLYSSFLESAVIVAYSACRISGRWGRHFSHAITTICKTLVCCFDALHLAAVLLRVRSCADASGPRPACRLSRPGRAARPSFLLFSHRLHLVLDATLLYLALTAAPSEVLHSTSTGPIRVKPGGGAGVNSFRRQDATLPASAASNPRTGLMKAAYL